MAYIGNKPANKAIVASDLDPAVITGQPALTDSPASTDEFLISDAGTLKRLDASLVGGGGITEADMYRLTASVTDDANPISSNIERVDDTTFAKIGTGVSVSSGVFSFASTGLYLVTFNATFFFDGGADSNVNAYIQGTSDNGSNWDYLALAECGGDTGNNKKKEATTQTYFNCTNVSTHKIRFKTESMASNSLLGNTDINKTTFTFIRLGDSQW